MITQSSRWPWLGLVVTLLVGACTSFQSVRPPGAGGEQLKPGDDVEVVTKDGNHYRLTVKAVDTEAIYGDQVSIPLSDIVSVDRKEISVGRTAGLASVPLLLPGLVLIIGIAVTGMSL